MLVAFSSLGVIRMRTPVALVTGACGEMGHLLLPALEKKGYAVVAIDLATLPPSLASVCAESRVLSILETEALERLFREYAPEAVYHLAAMLSSKAEREPDAAHKVNVEATLDLYRMSRVVAQSTGRNVKFLFPSSIAVYGLPDAAAKNAAGALHEEDWIRPSSMYGCNKVYCEMVGTYHSRRAAKEGTPGLDFRAIRFPGLISAETLPSGGTSDFAPEMIHAAAQGKPYSCFVSEGSRLPFMTMPDAIDAFLRLEAAPAEALSVRSYNIRAFSPTAAEIRKATLEHFPEARITFEPVAFRQAIIDSWPGDVDDTKARRDWGHAPRHGLREALDDYLLPALLKRYSAGAGR